MRSACILGKLFSRRRKADLRARTHRHTLTDTDTAGLPVGQAPVRGRGQNLHHGHREEMKQVEGEEAQRRVPGALPGPGRRSPGELTSI